MILLLLVYTIIDFPFITALRPFLRHSYSSRRRGSASRGGSTSRLHEWIGQCCLWSSPRLATPSTLSTRATPSTLSTRTSPRAQKIMKKQQGNDELTVPTINIFQQQDTSKSLVPPKTMCKPPDGSFFSKIYCYCTIELCSRIGRDDIKDLCSAGQRRQYI